MAEDFVGEIRMFAVPPGGGGWLPCDGRSLPIQNPYLSLYSLILTTYGGDGKTFFKLPDLRGRAVIGCGPNASNPLGTPGGTEMVALAATQLPGHTHNVRFSASKGSAPTPKEKLPAESVPVLGEEVLLYGVPGENPATTTLDPDTVASTGSGAPHSNLQPSMVIYYYIAYLGFYPERASEEDQGEGGEALHAPEATAPLGRKVRKPTSSAVDAYTGEVRVFAGSKSSIPDGWALCDGAQLKIANATQLFSLIGTVFGGDGVSAFCVPDLRGRVAVGLGNGPGLTPRPTIGETFGAMSVQLKAAQMPEHSHAFNVLTAPATLAAPTLGAMYAAPQEFLLYQGPSTSPVVKVAFAPGAVTNSDRESGLHDNMMPSLAMNYMICVQGIYPAQDEQPWVNAVVPASGPPVPPGDDDGTSAAESTLQVTLHGNALSGGVSLPAAAAPTVTFGTVAANVLSYSDTSIVVQCPPGNGTVTVEVTTPRGVSRANAGSQFSYVPSVTGLFPPAGSPAGGSAVTIKGIGLSGASAVMFGSVPAVGFEVLDDRTILATTPLQGGSVTRVNVTVTVNGQTSAATATNVFAITSLFIELTPGFGPAAGGNSVTVTGTNFSPSSGRVWFGDVMADSWTVVSATTIQAVAPPGVGVVDVTVESSASGTRSPPARYSYVAIVSGFSPTYGPSTGGTVVTIQGKNFDPASTVYFGSTAVTPTQTTPTQITVTTPSGRVTARLSVMGPGGASVGSHELPLFSYLPQLDSLSPAVGAPTGDPAVTLIGGNFTSDAAVSFGGTPATIIALSTTHIVVTPPNGVAGTAVDVTVKTGGGQSSALRYTYCTVGVTGLQPPAGPAGTSVEITGEGFGTNPSVAFGGVAATGVSVNSAGTLIVCTAPAGEGVVNVSVTASGATSPAVEASRYSYAPVLTALSTYTGKPLITQVTLTGEGFIAQPATGGQMAVMFGALSARQVQPSTTTSVTVWAPVTLGRVKVVVTTPGGTSNALDFTYVPAVLSIAPSYGTQGTVVQIVGAGLSEDGKPLDVQSVTFGITPALNFWTNGTDEVWAEVPAGAGTVPVVVKTAGGSTANWSGALFHYAPIVTSVVPSGGAPAGGTPLKITGSGFTGATAVMFDGVPGLYLNVPNDNEITVTTPPGTGEVTVVVRLPLAVSGPHEGATFTYGPVVKSLDPNSLSVKQTGLVWITGKGLDRILSIDFCGTHYGAETYGTWWAHGNLNGVRSVYLQTRPPTGGAGTYDVTVTTPEGTSVPVSFTWTS